MRSLVAISPTLQRRLDGSIPPTHASIIRTRARVAHDCKPLQAVSDMSITEWRRQGWWRRCWPQRVAGVSRRATFCDDPAHSLPNRAQCLFNYKDQSPTLLGVTTPQPESFLECGI